METLTQDELSLFVWNDRSCYEEGKYKAGKLGLEDSRLQHGRWVDFVIYALARYSNEILKEYNGCTLPLEEWGTMAARFRSEFVEHLKECDE